MSPGKYMYARKSEVTGRNLGIIPWKCLFCLLFNHKVSKHKCWVAYSLVVREFSGLMGLSVRHPFVLSCMKCLWKPFFFTQSYCAMSKKLHVHVWKVKLSSCFRVVKFHPDGERLELYSGGEDNKIRVWDLSSSTCSHVLDTHYSVITNLTFGNHGDILLRYLWRAQFHRIDAFTSEVPKNCNIFVLVSFTMWTI